MDTGIVFCYTEASFETDVTMSLEELNEKLYSRTVHLDRGRFDDALSPNAQAGEPTNPLSPKYEFNLLATGSAKKGQIIREYKRHRKFAWIVGGIVCFAILVGGVWLVRSNLFLASKITVNLSGPAQVVSAEKVTYRFEYGNDNWVGLSNSQVVFEYPDTFHPEAAPNLTINASRAVMSLGAVPSHGHGTVLFSGTFYGVRGEQDKLVATFQYHPSVYTSSFDKRIEYSVAVATSPIFFEVHTPQKLISGETAQYEIRYRNDGDKSYDALKVKLEYPNGFVFTSSNVHPTDDQSVFSIGTLTPKEEGIITIRGTLTGLRDEIKSLRGTLGFVQGDGKFVAYSESEDRTKMVASPLIIKQTINGKTDLSVNPGDELRFNFAYQNDGDVGMRDAVVMVIVNSPYIDFGSLRFSGAGGVGSYDTARHAILWKASDVPALARIDPGQNGTIQCSLRVYDNPEERVANAHDLAFTATAKIDSPDILTQVGVADALQSNTVTVKINTVVTAAFSGGFADTVIANTGPEIPIVGQTTTYTLHLALSTTSSEVKNGRVLIALPSIVHYTGQKSPENESVVFNESSNELAWDVKDFLPGQKRELVFQISFTPDQSLAGRNLFLVPKTVLTGQDAFTSHDIYVETNGFHVRVSS